jgi:hypothetical protein
MAISVPTSFVGPEPRWLGCERYDKRRPPSTLRTVDLDDAAANFVRSKRHCDNLIVVHRGSGGTGAGRRDEETVR